jgi:predicted nucleotidyltransferase
MSGPELIPALRAVLESHAALRLAYLFGSVGRGSASEGSDIDVAVLAASALALEERARLADELSRAIDFRSSVDVVDLRSAPPLLVAEVVRDGVRLVDRDPPARFDFEMNAIRRFEDTRYLRRLQQELLREAARGGA